MRALVEPCDLGLVRASDILLAVPVTNADFPLAGGESHIVKVKLRHMPRGQIIALHVRCEIVPMEIYNMQRELVLGLFCGDVVGPLEHIDIDGGQEDIKSLAGAGRMCAGSLIRRELLLDRPVLFNAFFLFRLHLGFVVLRLLRRELGEVNFYL